MLKGSSASSARPPGFHANANHQGGAMQDHNGGRKDAPSDSKSPDFWEFVHCSVCLKYFTESSNVPFWITDCGHIVCNSHLKPDQSCPSCHASAIELYPLQQDLPDGLFSFFQPLDSTLESCLSVSRFQNKTYTSLIQSYKRITAQQNQAIAALKSDIQMLQQQLLLYQHQQSGLDNNNQNGKRMRADSRASFQPQLQQQQMSSPRSIRSIPTPSRPQRLTLSHQQAQPDFTGPSHPTKANTQDGEMFERFAYTPFEQDPSTRSNRSQTHPAPPPNHLQQQYHHAPQQSRPHPTPQPHQQEAVFQPQPQRRIPQLELANQAQQPQRPLQQTIFTTGQGQRFRPPSTRVNVGNPVQMLPVQPQRQQPEPQPQQAQPQLQRSNPQPFPLLLPPPTPRPKGTGSFRPANTKSSGGSARFVPQTPSRNAESVNGQAFRGSVRRE